MLKKVRQIRVNINSGEILTNDQELKFFNKDHSTSILHVCGIPAGVKAFLVIKAPNTQEVNTIEGKAITVKNQECFEFQLPVDQAGKYQAQVKCTYSFQESYSNKFTYTSEEVIG